MWRAIRYGFAGDLIDLERGDVAAGPARIERLLEWVLPVAEEIGAAPLPLPRPLPESRMLAVERPRSRGPPREGAVPRLEIYAQQGRGFPPLGAPR